MRSMGKNELRIRAIVKLKIEKKLARITPCDSYYYEEK